MNAVKRLSVLGKAVVLGVLLATFCLAPFSVAPVVADGASGGQPGTPPDSTETSYVGGGLLPGEDALLAETQWLTVLRFVEF